MRRWVAAGAVGVLLVAGGAGVWVVTHGTPAQATAPTLATATTGTISQTVSASGTIEPASQANLSFAVGGTVASVPVQVGDAVTAGQTLATVGATDLQSAVDLAQAGVDAASAQLTAQQNAGASATQIASAQAQLVAAQSKLADSKQSLAEADLTSPITGTVAAVNVAVGDRVSGSAGSASSGSGGSGSGGGGSGAGGSGAGGSGAGASGLGAGSGGGGSSSVASVSGASSSGAQIVVISTRSWLVDASVGSADLPRLSKGLQAQITPTGSSTLIFGTVQSIGIVATTTGGAAAFPVTIAVTGSPSGLYAGGTADVSIVVRQLNDVLTVPTASVHTVGGRTVVYQLRNGSQVQTAVTVGATYGGSTQILGGITAGAQVVVRSVRVGGTGSGTSGRARQGGGFGGGGFGGGGFGGGGFTGGTGGAGGGGFGGGGFGGGGFTGGTGGAGGGGGGGGGGAGSGRVGGGVG